MSIMSRRGGVVIITGASAGVGRAAAARFARAGFAIGLIARDAPALMRMQATIAEAGGTAVVAAADVADADALAAAAKRIEAALGPVDIWINDAMETVFSTVADTTPVEFRRVTEVTYLGCVYGTMVALRSMRARGRGRIIQMGSALAHRGIPLQAAYSGAKHAIRGFTDVLRSELIHERSRIRVTIVDLPAVNTPQFAPQFDWARAHTSRVPRPMGTPITPEVAAEAVFRAAQGRWRAYSLGMPVLLAILGNGLLPGLLDRYLARTAVSGQQTETPVMPARPDNLDRPLAGLHRTQGPFGREAKKRAPLVPAPFVRAGVIIGGAFAFLGLGLCLLVDSRKR